MNTANGIQQLLTISYSGSKCADTGLVGAAAWANLEAADAVQEPTKTNVTDDSQAKEGLRALRSI